MNPYTTRKTPNTPSANADSRLDSDIKKYHNAMAKSGLSEPHFAIALR